MRYTGPSIPTADGGHIHAIPLLPETAAAALGAESLGMRFAASSKPTGKIKTLRFFVNKKKKQLCGICIVEASNGARFVMGTCLPLSMQEITDIEREAAQLEGEIGLGPLDYEIGWNPWKSIKKAAKTIGKTTKVAAKGMGRVVTSPTFQKIAMATVAPGTTLALEALKNPAIRNFALQMAPMAGAAFGVPPNITAMATGVLQNAMQGSAPDMGKVRNIAMQASQGNPAAVQVRNTMSMLYRGGMQAYQQTGQLPQHPYMPQIPPLPQYVPPMRVPQYMPPQMPYGPPRMPYGMQRFNIPTPGFGRGYVSGWLYNVPYRSPADAKNLDLSNPFNKVRGLYSSGVQVSGHEIGRRRPGTIQIARHKRAWPPSAAVPDPAGSWHWISSHTRRMPDVWGEPDIGEHDQNYEIGRRKRGRVSVESHSRGWPNAPEYDIDIDEYTRRMPDVW